MARLRLAAAAIFVALALLALATRALWPKSVTVWIDDGGDVPITVTADGGPAVGVASQRIGKLTLGAGQHRLRALGPDGAAVDEVTFAARPRGWFEDGSYIWNVGGYNRYAVYTMSYGADRRPHPPEPIGAGERIFAIPAGVGPELLGPMPETVTASGRSALERRVYHLPLHRDRPCCSEILKMVRDQEQGHTTP